MIEGVHHISIIVSSEDCVSFYKHLGLSEVFRIERQCDTVVGLHGYGIEVELFVDPRHPKRNMGFEPTGLRYFSLKVDDIDQMYKKYNCSPIKTDWVGQRYCFIYDPDGLPIQIHE